MSDPENRAAAFAQALREHGQAKYVLRLYVAGMTTTSLSAVGSVKALCEEMLAGRYELTVVDLSQHPEQASEHNVIATPTLVKELPPPLRKLVGHLSDRVRVFKGLDIWREP